MNTPKQTQDTLWTLIIAPTVWALHFLLCYIVAAFQCAPNVEVFEPIGGTRALVAGLTAVALAIIALVFRRSLGEWRGHGRGFRHDADSDLDRERFLEFSTLLLAALSFVAVIFVALPAVFNVDCR
ncbi:hypothetical protein [Aurantimonas sp. HBX-1]|uniref:hypothetical protein n=1 Tax=Aurantimonas sp. HBX-1 TaxID=2906072 RepID=UPI001F414584|nr:hypothetical protein [Aurantimonas sp. HBX-1]UIJ71904.1 hypothetical protein LXB15_19840 [Aurantimonas sp. HBX-1]